jgi:hypothetical protein
LPCAFAGWLLLDVDHLPLAAWFYLYATKYDVVCCMYNTPGLIMCDFCCKVASNWNTLLVVLHKWNFGWVATWEICYI